MRIKKSFAIIVTLAALALLAAGCKRMVEPEAAPGDYQRVVALSPSLSETLYALGLGDRVVGVTAFASYPEEVKQKAKIGGYADINVEAVYALKPDLVLALKQQEGTVRQLRELGLNLATFKDVSFEDILNMIEGVGQLFDHSESAAAICGSIQQERGRLARMANGKPKRRVLVSVGRNMGTGAIGDVYAAGPKTLYGEIIQMTGSENVYQGQAPYAALGKEAILRLNPDVIIDLIPDMDTLENYTRAAALKQWSEFEHLDAVRQGRVTINMASYICIPGPRIIQLMGDIAAAIHPEQPQ